MKMKFVKIDAGQIVVEFESDRSSDTKWNFKPSQKSVKIYPGETALAFYEAYNPTDEEISGLAMYSIIPNLAGKYFHKIQCFCFEGKERFRRLERTTTETTRTDRNASVFLYRSGN
jgi:cytochrome c oxidase assembly protein Cox11